MAKRKKKSQPKKLPNLGQAKVENKQFWVIISILFVFSIITIISSITDTTITANAAIQTIGFAQEGEELFFEVRNVEGLKDAKVIFKENVKNGKILFTESESIPFEGIAYSKFSVSSNDGVAITSMDLTLRLDREIMRPLNLNENDVTLYVNGEAKTTTKSREDDRYIYYETSTTELGPFVIGVEVLPQVQVTEPEVQEQQEPVEEPQRAPPVLTGSIEQEEKPVVEPTEEVTVQEEMEDGFFTKVGRFFGGLFS